MNFLDIAKRRYTTKRYTNNEKIEEDKINTLKHILRLSPSSINVNLGDLFLFPMKKLKRNWQTLFFGMQRKLMRQVI